MVGGYKKAEEEDFKKNIDLPIVHIEPGEWAIAVTKLKEKVKSLLTRFKNDKI